MPNSSGITDVRKLAQELHDSKVINLDTSVGALLKSAQGIGTVSKDKGSEVSANAIGWEGYLLITKGMPADMRQLEKLSQKTGGQR